MTMHGYCNKCKKIVELIECGCTECDTIFCEECGSTDIEEQEVNDAIQKM